MVLGVGVGWRVGGWGSGTEEVHYPSGDGDVCIFMDYNSPPPPQIG